MIIGIVAIAKNYAIGKDGKLPWHYSEDLKFFKRTTVGNTVVMGFNTFKSIGKPLPKRLNVILSRSHKTETKPDLVSFSTPEDIIKFSKFLRGNLYIIGGATTYESFATHIERWIVTEIPGVVDGADSFMEQDFLDGFTETSVDVLDEELLVKTYEKMS